MKSARDYSMTLVKDPADMRRGLTVVKSISAVKRAKPVKKSASKASKKVARKTGGEEAKAMTSIVFS